MRIWIRIRQFHCMNLMVQTVSYQRLSSISDGFTKHPYHKDGRQPFGNLFVGSG